MSERLPASPDVPDYLRYCDRDAEVQVVGLGGPVDVGRELARRIDALGESGLVDDLSGRTGSRKCCVWRAPAARVGPPGRCYWLAARGEANASRCGQAGRPGQLAGRVGECARISCVLARVREEAGRDPASLRRIHAPNFQLFDSERELKLWREHPDRGMSAAEVDACIRRRGAFYGTASAIGARAEEFISLGCGGFVIFINESPALAGLEQLASPLPYRSGQPRQNVYAD